MVIAFSVAMTRRTETGLDNLVPAAARAHVPLWFLLAGAPRVVHLPPPDRPTAEGGPARAEEGGGAS